MLLTTKRVMRIRKPKNKCLLVTVNDLSFISIEKELEIEYKLLFKDKCLVPPQSIVTRQRTKSVPTMNYSLKCSICPSILSRGESKLTQKFILSNHIFKVIVERHYHIKVIISMLNLGFSTNLIGPF